MRGHIPSDTPLRPSVHIVADTTTSGPPTYRPHSYKPSAAPDVQSMQNFPDFEIHHLVLLSNIFVPVA